MTETRMLLEDWLDDLCVRFIINLPEEDLSSVARICFQVEEAQWFYEDFIRPLDPSLPSMSLRSFCLRIFQHCPLLSAFSADNHMRAFEEFLLYKTRVPVRGAIMLNNAMDSVLLVKGWKKGANWSFPRGKINKDEDDLDCAIREVYEETGYDIREAGLVPANEEVKYIEITMREQHMRLYIFRDIPMETHFEPRTRKEISKIQWYRLSELPAFRRKGQMQAGDDVEAAVNANKFYMVAPFLVPLKKWVIEQKKKDTQKALSSQHLMPSLVDEFMTEEESGVEKKNLQMGVQERDTQTQWTAGLDTMEGATAALHRLLKVQPPTQGLQPEAASAVQSPASRNSGEALLALLQGKSVEAQHNSQLASRGQTPLELTQTGATIPKTAPNYHFWQQPIANVPSQPLFPTQPYHNSDPQPEVQTQTMQESGERRLRAHQTSGEGQSQKFLDLPRQVHQPQQLQHPQPLPPQVQRTVFAGDQVHGPAIPQTITQLPELQHIEAVSITGQSLQFSNIHGPVLSPALDQVHPKLTTHSLALLNAFKSTGDQATPISDNENKVLLNRLNQVATDHSGQLQELSADESRRDGRSPPNLSNLNVRPYPELGTFMLPTESAPVDDHRKSLLSMFKTSAPKSTNSGPAANITSPADIQQASEATSSGQPSMEPVLSVLSRQAEFYNAGKTRPQPHLTGPSPPFQPLSSNAPPSQGPADSLRILNSSSTRQDDILKSYLNNVGSSTAENRRLPTDLELSAHSARNLHPQILKQPQPMQQLMPVELAASPTFSPSLYTQPLLNRRVNQPAEQKEALLSLFRRAPTSAAPVSQDQNKPSQAPERASDMAPEVIPHARVGSIASAGGDIISESSSRRGSHAPISAADKGFLLGYLDAFARGGDK